MEKTGCKIICGAPTTLAVKGLMMMMMKGVLLLNKTGLAVTQHMSSLTGIYVIVSVM